MSLIWPNLDALSEAPRRRAFGRLAMNHEQRFERWTKRIGDEKQADGDAISSAVVATSAVAGISNATYGVIAGVFAGILSVTLRRHKRNQAIPNSEQLFPQNTIDDEDAGDKH